MGDLNQFKRSKERIAEVLSHLVRKNAEDENTNLFIEDLQKSIKILDLKMEELYFSSAPRKY